METLEASKQPSVATRQLAGSDAFEADEAMELDRGSTEPQGVNTSPTAGEAPPAAADSGMQALSVEEERPPPHKLPMVSSRIHFMHRVL